MSQNIVLNKQINMKHELIDVTSTIYSLLCNMTNSWAITGGHNLFLRGIKDYTKDIDIITTKKGAFEAQEYLISYVVKKVRYCETSHIRSYFGQACIHNYRVEIMGNPENLINTQWIVNAKWADNIQLVHIGGNCIPLISLDYELFINKLIDNKERVIEIKLGIEQQAKV